MARMMNPPEAFRMEVWKGLYFLVFWGKLNPPKFIKSHGLVVWNMFFSHDIWDSPLKHIPNGDGDGVRDGLWKPEIWFFGNVVKLLINNPRIITIFMAAINHPQMVGFFLACPH